MTSTNTYAILGAARSGLAAARLLRREGARVFVSEAGAERDGVRRELEQIGADCEFGGHTSRVLECDVVVLSPGVPDTIDIVGRARERGISIVSEIEIAARRCRGRIAAITGTNGKTTTTELAGFLLRHGGVKTFVAGNVGLAFSEIALDADDQSVVVLELSSFQLEHIETFRPSVAVLLNITPDHLDRYESFEHYAQAKFRIAMNQTADDVLVYNADDQQASRLAGNVRSHPLGFSINRTVEAGAFVDNSTLVMRFGSHAPSWVPNSPTNEQQIMHIDEIGIRGPHNLYNAMAAALLARVMGVESEAIADGLRAFPGVPHRLEPVREIDGVQWINDSKATNVNALACALESFDQPVVLIAGGRSKNNDYTDVLPLVARKVKAMVLVGEAAEEMRAAFADVTHTIVSGTSLKQAVRQAHDLASPGDVVLLSPACASFDMFDNFERRGEAFRQHVEELAPGSLSDQMTLNGIQ